MRGTVPSAVRDPARLAAVRRSGLLDTPAEEPFDRLARLAAMVLRVPFAFVTVVDARRSFWKSCIGVTSDDPADRQNLVEESFCQYVVGSGEPLVVEDAAHDHRTRDNPSVEKGFVAAWAGFPVHSPDGQVLGTFCVLDSIPRHWSEEDVETLRTLAAAATGEVALRSALADSRRRTGELTGGGAATLPLVQALQSALLPPELPPVPGLDVGAVHHPGGGDRQLLCDFYDVFPVSEERWDVVLGDVCGEGATAARLASLARSTARTAAVGAASPAAVLSAVHDTVLRHHPRRDSTVSLAHVVLRRTGSGFDVTFASNGHPPALLHRAAHGSTSVLEGGPSPLGGPGDIAPRDVRLSLGPGDGLLLHTDGLVHATGEGGVPLGLARLRDAVEEATGGAADLARAAAAAGSAWSGGHFEDDVAVVVLRVLPA